VERIKDEAHVISYCDRNTRNIRHAGVAVKATVQRHASLQINPLRPNGHLPQIQRKLVLCQP